MARRGRRFPPLEEIVRYECVIAEWVGERIPYGRQPGRLIDECMQLARSFLRECDPEIIAAIAAARSSFGPDTDIENVLVALDPALRTYAEARLGCSLLAVPGSPYGPTTSRSDGHGDPAAR